MHTCTLTGEADLVSSPPNALKPALRDTKHRSGRCFLAILRNRASYLFVSVFERQRGPRHLLQKVLPVFLVLIGRDEDDLQFVLVFRRLLEPAVELAQAAVELLARGVQAASEEEPDQGELGARRLHVHLGFLAVDEPLPEQTHQELRHRARPLARAEASVRVQGDTRHFLHLQFEGFFSSLLGALRAPVRRRVCACVCACVSPRLVLRCERCAGMRCA